MDARHFLAEFGHIANAPGGIVQLRQMIYQLAVTGSLTPRGEDQTDAESLLADIALTRQRLIRAKQYKRMRELESEPVRPPLGIDLPPSWRWTRLVDIGEINPRNDGSDAQLAAFLPMSGVPQVHHGKVVAETRRWDEIKKGYTHFANGDVVLAKITPCFENGKAAYITGLPCESGIGAGTTELHVFRPIHPGIVPGYVYLYLRSPLFVVEGERNMTGTAGQKRLPTDYFATRAFPLPPTEEQSRIVAKVDELMALCDTFEAQQQDRRELQNALRVSTLQAVAAAPSPHELQTTWARLETTFGRLFSGPDDVKELRSLVRQLGIRGLLVEQCETGREKVENFLRDVQSKREQLVARGVIRRATLLPSLNEADEPFPLPRGWMFCRLGQVSICRDGERIPLSKAEREPRRGPFPYYGASGVIDHIDNFLFEEELLLIGEDGANLINRSTPIAFIAKGRYWVNNHAHVLDSVNGVALQYLELFINAIDLRPYVTGTAQPKMNQEKMNRIVVAVPPPEEQALIVERVQELLRLCDGLEAQLRDGQILAERLAYSAASTLTGIAVERAENEAMKAPQIEVIAAIRLGTPPDVKAQAPLATLLARHNGEMSARDLWQRFGGDIDGFYAQLKTEVVHGWLQEPAVAEVRERSIETVSA